LAETSKISLTCEHCLGFRGSKTGELLSVPDFLEWRRNISSEKNIRGQGRQINPCSGKHLDGSRKLEFRCIKN